MKFSDLEKRRRPGKAGVEREVVPLVDGGGLIRITLDKKEKEFLEKVAEIAGFVGHTRLSMAAKHIFLDVIDTPSTIGDNPFAIDERSVPLVGWMIVKVPKSNFSEKVRKHEVQYSLNSAELMVLRKMAEAAGVPEAEYARACIMQLMNAMEKADREDE
jgi:hypothetical protein